MKNQIQTFKEHIKELVSKQFCALCGRFCFMKIPDKTAQDIK